MVYFIELETIIAKIMLIRHKKDLPLITNYGQIEKYVDAVNSVISARNIDANFNFTRSSQIAFEKKYKAIFEIKFSVISIKKDFNEFTTLEQMAKLYNKEIAKAMEDENILRRYGII